MPLKLVKRGDVWYLRGTVRGIRIFETAGTSQRDKAETLRAKREAELYEESVFGKRAVVSFQRAALSYLEFEDRGPVDKRYVGRLVRHFEGRLLSQIDQGAADRAVTAIVGNDAAPATKRRGVLAPLIAILNHAADRRWCEHPRFKLPALPKGKTRWLTPAEAHRLIEAAVPHLRPLFHFILSTGARISEALDLEWHDVDLPAAKVVFRDTKNGADRAAALPEAVVATLVRLPGEEIEPGKWEKRGKVFRRDDGEPYADRQRLAGGQIKTGWRGACKRAGVTRAVFDEAGKLKLDSNGKPLVEPSARPHDLRHTWASWFYALTKDPLLLKAEGGWQTLSMVERYAHLMSSSMLPEISSIWGHSHPRIGVLPRANGAKSEQVEASVKESA